MLPRAKAHLDQLVRQKQTCCPAYQALPAQELKQVPRCPFFLSCLLLEYLRHGPPRHDGSRGGSAGRAERSLRMSDSTHGRQPEQEADARLLAVHFTSRLRSSLLMPPHGTTSPETGGRDQCIKPKLLLGSLPGQATTGNSSPNHGGNQDVACAAQREEGDTTAGSTALTGTVPGSDQTIGPHRLHQERGLNLERGALQSHLITEDMQIPELQWDSQAKQLVPRANSSTWETTDRNQGHVGSATPTCSQGWSHCKIPRPGQPQSGAKPNHTMEVANEPTTREQHATAAGQMQHSAIWQYIQRRVRPWSQKRSALAQRIQQSMPRASKGKASKQHF